jgi:acetyl esterase/lipase
MRPREQTESSTRPRRALPAFLFLLLVAPFAAGLGPGDVSALPASEPNAVERYGPDERQFGELRLPEGKGPFPVAVVVHGGCWLSGLATVRNTAPIATDLARSGVATWNIEYRQIGDPGGGWPGSFLDWGAATDHLRILAKSHPLDLGRVAAVGHSAGAHVALWLAARAKLAPGSAIRGADPLAVKAAVAIDGPGNLSEFIGLDAKVCERPVVVDLVGGTPQQRPERYREASPAELLPFGVAQTLVATAVLSRASAETYRAAAVAGGDAVDVLSPPQAGHYEPIAPGETAWSSVKQRILEHLGVRRRAVR